MVFSRPPYPSGALGDSFYEYLLKSWIQTGKKDAQARRMYDNAIKRISEVGVFPSIFLGCFQSVRPFFQCTEEKEHRLFDSKSKRLVPFA